MVLDHGKDNLMSFEHWQVNVLVLQEDVNKFLTDAINQDA